MIRDWSLYDLLPLVFTSRALDTVIGILADRGTQSSATSYLESVLCHYFLKSKNLPPQQVSQVHSPSTTAGIIFCTTLALATSSVDHSRVEAARLREAFLSLFSIRYTSEFWNEWTEVAARNNYDYRLHLGIQRSSLTPSRLQSDTLIN